MPLFEFTCSGCGHQFETLVMGSRKPACPKCQSEELQKRFSTFGARSSSGSSRPSAAPRFT
ncbi:MAG TPA: zinc ribbon domain-containing protein [Vicinamibacterales bacterium]